MSKLETSYQRQLLKIFRTHGGWGSKWASGMLVGVPDLLVSFPTTGLVACEVKRMSAWNLQTERQVSLTKGQRLCLRDMIEHGAVALVALVVEGPGPTRVGFFPGTVERIHREEYLDRAAPLKDDVQVAGCFFVACWEREGLRDER